jgi:hypothetical protein
MHWKNLRNGGLNKNVETWRYEAVRLQLISEWLLILFFSKKRHEQKPSDMK